MSTIIRYHPPLRRAERPGYDLKRGPPIDPAWEAGERCAEGLAVAFAVGVILAIFAGWLG